MPIDDKSTYYDAGGIEVMEIIKAKLTPEQYRGFLLGNIIKYACRANHKAAFNRDVEKAGVYQRKLLDAMMGETEPTQAEPAHNPFTRIGESDDPDN